MPPKKAKTAEKAGPESEEGSNKAATVSVRWKADMVETLIELRFDTGKAIGKRFLNARNNADLANAWQVLALAFNERHECSVDIEKIKSRVDKLKAEYRQIIAKFRETGNVIESEESEEGEEEEAEEREEERIRFKKGIDFSLYPWLPAYWATLNAYMGGRAGLNANVLACSASSAAKRDRKEDEDDDAGSAAPSPRNPKKGKGNEMAAVLASGFEMIGNALAKSEGDGVDNDRQEMRCLLKEQQKLLQQNNELLASQSQLLSTMCAALVKIADK
jgi:hypothetical protein